MITLYDKAETNFEHNGIGSLEQDIIDPKIHWIDNGVFSFEFEYPLFAKHGLEITNSSIIKARDPEQDNLFFVYKVIPSMGYIKVYCYQIFYKLAFNTINDTNIVKKNGQGALTQLSGATQYPHKFQLTSDLTNIATSRVVRKNPVEILLDSNLDNSFINRWGGHIIRHGFNISWNQSYGSNKGYKIQHKKDLMGYEATIDETTVVTRIRPVGYDGLLLPEIYVDSPLIDHYPEPRIQEYAYSDVKVGKGEGEFATAALAYVELRRLTKLEFSQNKIDVPRGIYKVDFVNLKETEEYKNFAPLKQILPGDIVAVEHEEDGINISSQMVEYNWEPLLKEYIDLTLGNYERSFTSTINKLDKIQTDIKDIHNQIELVYLSADGKNKIYSGEIQPIIDQNSTEGDLWFKKNGDKTELWILRTVNGVLQWVVELSDATQEELKAAVNNAILQADKDRTKAEEEISQALLDAKNYTEIKAQEFDNQLLIVNQNLTTAKDLANAAVTKADKAIEDVGFLKPDVATAKANAATAIQDAATATQSATTAIQNAQTALNSVATLSQEVEVSITNINGELTRKVSQTTFNTLSGTVVTHTTQIGQTQNALLAKAESSLVNTIKGTVDTHTTQIKVVSDGLELKAESSLVNTVKGTVDNHSSLISANSQAISARLTSAQIETLLTGKQYVNQTTLNATSSGLTAQITQVETGLSSKSDIVEQMTGAAGKVFKNPVSYNQNVQAITGYLIIKTPILSPFMSKVSISGYNYAGATSNIDLDVSFYAYTATQFVNFSYVNKGNFPIDSVKLARDSSGRTIIIIGKPTTVWNYPKMQVVQAIIGQTNPPENYKDGWSMEYSTDISVYTAQTNVTGPDYNTKITTIDVTVNGLQTTVANKAEQSQVTQLAGQVQTKVESATYNSKMTQLDSAINLRVVQSDVTAAILADKTVKDTRNDNQLPSWYNNNYARTSVTEFKLRTVMGLPGSAIYVQLTTKSPWNGSSGGEIVQIAESADGTYQRTSVGNLITWGVWDKVAEAGKLISQINISTEGILLQGKRIQLDGDVAMNAAFIARLDTQTLTAVTANIASIRTQILTANIVDSIMIKSDTALITKLFATDANVQILTAKTAFINSVKAIDIAADRITAGTLNAALVNIINLNANRITSGTISGANSAWDLNTGIISVTNPTSGDLLQFTQGRIRFQNGAQERLLNYNAEGLQLKAGVNNTGTSKNTSLWLIGEGSGSYAYIQFVENNTASTDQRLEAEGGNIRVLTAPGGKFEVRTNGTRALNEILSSASQVTGVSGAFMRMTPGSIETERYGNRSLKLMPTGTGKVEVTDGTYWWNVKAKEFETVSSRKLKTNIIAYTGNGLDAINSLNVMTYNLKQDLADGKVIEKIGLISEDSPIVAGSDGLSINTYTLNMLSLKALQELDRKVISIENVIFANNALASQALNKSNLVVSEMQQLKNKVTELELKIKKWRVQHEKN